MNASEALADPPMPLHPVAGLRVLADRYDVVLCDIWGVLHNGQQVFASAVDAIARFREGGGTVVLITNAPRPHPPVLEQITELGVHQGAYDAAVTSGDVTVAAIAAEGDRPIFHIGPPRDRALFEAVGRATGVTPRLAALPDAEVVVVTGLSDDRSETPADYASALAAMRARDLLMICANPDIVVHIGDALIYCAGALAQAYEALGGRTLLAGKPHPPIYDAALALAAEHRGQPTPPSRVLAIGDGLVTDGAGAARRGLDLLLITGGIHRDEFHEPEGLAFDPRRYAERLLALEHPPVAAMPVLAW